MSHTVKNEIKIIVFIRYEPRILIKLRIKIRIKEFQLKIELYTLGVMYLEPNRITFR